MTGFPSNWTQEASNNLTAIARDAVRTAREEPGEDVNPLHGTLQSAVRYEGQLGHYVITCCQPGGRLDQIRRLTSPEASDALKNGWGNELYGGFAQANSFEIVRDRILGPPGTLASERW
jgi:hypothetical protein